MPSLEDLEDDRWPDPGPEATPLIRRCHELRRVPIAGLAAEDLRMLIGQSIGLDALVPVALDVVEANPLESGDLYEGDLLVGLFAVPRTYWTEHADQWLRVCDIAAHVVAIADDAATFLRAADDPRADPT